MALKKKGSRKIVVGNETYRWKVLPKDEPDLGIVVEHYSEPKQRFILWITDASITTPRLVVATPRLVESAIEYALQNGWEPLERGKELWFRWENTSHHISSPLDYTS